MMPPRKGRLRNKPSHTANTLEPKANPNLRASHFQVVKYGGAAEVILQMAVAQGHIEIFERVADANTCLPCEITVSGADVSVIKQSPPVIDLCLALQADNTIP